jgi:hypothetical protein
MFLVSKQRPSVAIAVETFLSSFKKLKHLPFVSDQEASGLYGLEVSIAVAELDHYNRQHHLCKECQSRCCLRVKCEMYDIHFGTCLVESYRPVLCRLHFCNKSSNIHQPLVKILGDIYLESLIAAAKIDSVLANMFDCPTFTPLAPHLMSLIKPILDKTRSGLLTEQNARLEIQVLIEQNALAIIK